MLWMASALFSVMVLPVRVMLPVAAVTSDPARWPMEAVAPPVPTA